MTRSNLPPDAPRQTEELKGRVTDLERILRGLGKAGVFDLIFSRGAGPELSLPFPATRGRRYGLMTVALDVLSPVDVTATIQRNGSVVASLTVPANQWRWSKPVAITVSDPDTLRATLPVLGVVKLDWTP